MEILLRRERLNQNWVKFFMQISEAGIRNMLSFEFCYLKEHGPARVLLAFFLQVLQPKIGVLTATLKTKQK